MNLLTAEQVAAKLQVHPVTARELLRKGRLGVALKIGKCWRLPEAELERALAAFAVSPPVSRAARRSGLEPSVESVEALRPRRKDSRRLLP